MEFGQRFRTLRKSKQVTLKELADASVSEASISRFENGLQDLGVQVVEHLLNKMGVTMREWCNQNAESPSRLGSFNNIIGQLHMRRDLVSLRQQFNQVYAAYRLSKDKDNLFKMGVIASAIVDLDGNNLLNRRECQQLFTYLFDVEIWDSATLTKMGGVIILFDVNQIWTIFTSIVGQLDEISRADYIAYGDAWDIVLNCYEVVIQRDVAVAQQMKLRLNQQEIPALAVSIHLRQYFLNQLLTMMGTSDRMQQFLAQEKVVRMTELLREAGDQMLAVQSMEIMDRVLSARPK
mgnify:CR=1 FL=1